MSRATASNLTLRISRQIFPSTTHINQIQPIRALSTALLSQSSTSITNPQVSTLRTAIQSKSTIKSFSTTSLNPKGLSPESENPPTKDFEQEPSVAPAEITAETYHELSDDYMNALVEKLEQLQEESEEIDCEYSAGVLTLTFPPNGTYVINKQPPNKQIWLSSPITGPKRYDYVMLSEGQDAKEGTGRGEWVYLRDGSTLTALLQTEIGVDMLNLYAPVAHRGD